MKVSTEQIEKIVSSGGRLTPNGQEVDEAVIRLLDKELIEEVVQSVRHMPDRDDLVEKLKAQIKAGTYKPTGEEIADSIVRRMVADSIR